MENFFDAQVFSNAALIVFDYHPLKNENKL